MNRGLMNHCRLARARRIVCGLVLWAVCFTQAEAATDSPPPHEPRVYRATINPHWLPDGHRFWYQNDNSTDFILVDAKKAERRVVSREEVATIDTSAAAPGRTP